MATTFVEVTDIEKAQELCEAGLLWFYGEEPYSTPGMRPWVPHNDPTDCPHYWGDGWKYYILVEE